MKALFDKTNIKGMKMKNRFIKAAVWEELASEDGHMTDDLFEIYRELAEGGIGTILTGYSYVTENEHPNPRMMGIYDDSFIEEYRKLTDMVHQNGANIVMQIVYGGTMTNLNPPSPLIWGPSDVRDKRTGIVPVPMTREDIDSLVDSFASAAERVAKAGFDGVEIHAAHGYMLSQFLSPRLNRREDEYGGTLDKRARILVEIVKKVRNKVGEDFPILVKINSSDFMEDGLTEDDSIAVSRLLEEAGVDAFEVSGGNESEPSVLENNLGPARTGVARGRDRESYFRDHGKRLAKALSVPVILTGGNRHYDVMEEILEDSEIEYFALGRPMISEPDLIKTWESGNMKSPKCVSCNKCYETYGKRCILNA